MAVASARASSSASWLTGSRPGSSQRAVSARAMTETTATPVIIQAIGSPIASDTVPTTAPATVPSDQKPWKLLMTERP